MERRQLGLLGDAHAHALARGPQQRLHVRTRPARHPGCREGVVVEPAAPDRGAAVVTGAAADHACALELDAPPAVAVVAAVAQLVRLCEPRRVEHVRRPAAALEGAEVGPGLEHEDRLVRALGQQAGERGTGRAAADDERVDAPGEFLHGELTSLRPCEAPRTWASLAGARFMRFN